MKYRTRPPRTLPLILVTFIIFLRISPAIAQGGPPMLTDDSGVPGAGKWENNFAFEFEGSKNDYVKNFPIFDLNYGLGDRIQLKAEFTWLAEKGEKLANKFDNITLGFKYRIIDGKDEDLSLSVYPQPIISFNPEQEGKSASFGIVLPVAINKEIAGIGVNLQGGYQTLGNASEFFLGLCLGHDFGKILTLLGEIHTTVGRTHDNDVTGEDAVYFKEGTFINLGAQIKISGDQMILLAIGKDVESPGISSDEANFYGYIGLQFLM
ncbi:MAG: hypothetical protein ACHQM6_02350 [Candidatus Kapaibacterium sp.]